MGMAETRAVSGLGKRDVSFVPMPEKPVLPRPFPNPNPPPPPPPNANVENVPVFETALDDPVSAGLGCRSRARCGTSPANDRCCFSDPSRTSPKSPTFARGGNSGTGGAGVFGYEPYLYEKSGTLARCPMLVPTVTRVVIVLPDTGRCLMSRTASSSIGSSERNSIGEVVFTDGVTAVGEWLLLFLLCKGRSEEDLRASGRTPGMFTRKDGRGRYLLAGSNDLEDLLLFPLPSICLIRRRRR